MSSQYPLSSLLLTLVTNEMSCPSQTHIHYSVCWWQHSPLCTLNSTMEVWIHQQLRLALLSFILQEVPLLIRLISDIVVPIRQATPLQLLDVVRLSMGYTDFLVCQSLSLYAFLLFTRSVQ